MLYPRRKFIKKSIIAGSAAMVLPYFYSCKESQKNMPESIADEGSDEMFFKISLAQWSLHKAIFAGDLDHLDFAAQAKGLGIEGIEYVNQFFKDKAEDQAYLDQMNQRAADNGVTQLIIMVDREGNLGDTDEQKRKEAIENHYKWVNAAKSLGCHSIRVNAAGNGTAEEVSGAAIDGLGRLSEYAAKENINVIVENHGGYSSDGQWLSNVMAQVNLSNCGTLPDFGNFCVERDKEDPYGKPCAVEYDRYQGMKDLMPYAKAVSAKAHDFDADGNEIHTDFLKVMQIVKDHNYKGWVGIEYEGNELDEMAGIKATRDLLLKVGKQLS
jgi:sugar phosphate isomerase/epimerase